jgi:hypothetical protein
MPDNTVEIVISTRAELDGVKNLKRELEGQIGVSKALGRDYSNLGSQLSKVNAAISKAAPEFSSLTGLIGKLAGGPLTALASGLAIVARGILETKTRLAEFIQAEMDAGKAAVDTKKLIDTSKISEDYKHSLTRIKVAAGEAATKLEGLRREINALKDAEDVIATAKKDKDIAQVEADVATGKITPAQGDVKKAAIEGKSIQEGATRQKALLASEDNFAANEAEIKRYAAMIAQKEVDDIQGRLGGVTSAKPFEDLAAHDQKTLDDLQKLFDDLDAQIEQMRPMFKPQGFWETLSAAALPWNTPTPAQTYEWKALNEQQGRGSGTIGRQQTVLNLSRAKEARVKADLARLPDAKDAAEAAKDEAKAAGIQSENQRKINDAGRNAINQSLPEKLRPLSLRTGVTVLGHVEQQASADAAEFKRNRGHGFQGVPNMGPQISSQGQIVARAIAKMGGSFEAAMMEILRAVQANTNRVQQLEQRASRRELR